MVATALLATLFGPKFQHVLSPLKQNGVNRGCMIEEKHVLVKQDRNAGKYAGAVLCMLDKKKPLP
ncbi:hypothetical protein E2562_028116 [Oryza meyeriana var. granulata]|uniref:Uncharacterized protein n=1 Tax=Oryza meyeriana var. granulata TaxID=110450 RepID=A0A6G1C9G2_9ORYZ|nr:hypothetical protein E2562_028116 [Oryza meyeriana var. granulata]